MRLCALTFALTCTLPALAQQIDDPANLMGERVSPPALADTLPINHGAPALEQLLRKLRTRASMMLIVAHPDDEDSGLLTLESRGMGARVAMLTLTRGEGGQNLMSADFNDALGLIRTQELLAEDRFTGVDQFFGTEVDFGFSKTKEESFRKWTHDRVLYDAVRCVRLYRPLVLASVFVGGVTDGHGQHQVSGEIAQEVFLAAADPQVFPEMGLPPWAPLRVYARVPFSRVTPQGMYDYATGRWSPPLFHNYVTGEDITHEPVASVTIHEGDKPAIPAFNGLSYVQWARQGLALQKSQIGPNVRIPPAGAFDVGYTLMASRDPCTASTGCPILPGPSSEKGGVSRERATSPTTPPQSLENDLFTGLDTSLPSIATLAPSAPASLRTTLISIDAKIAEAQRPYNPDHLELTALPLRDALRTLDTLIASTESSTPPPTEKFNLLHELRIKRVQLNNALVLAEGTSLSALVGPGDNAQDHDLQTTKQYVPVQIKLKNGGKHAIDVTQFEVEGGDSTPPGFFSRVTPGSEVVEQSGKDNNTGFAATRPYFSRPSREQPFYDLARPELRNAPATPLSVVAYVVFDDGESISRSRNEARIELRVIVPDSSVTREDNPRRAAAIVPPVSIQVSPSAGIITTESPTFEVSTTVSPFRLKDTLPDLQTPQGWVHKPVFFDPMPPEGSDLTEQWHITPANLIAGDTYEIKAFVESKGHTYTEGYRAVGYPGLTYTNFFTPATFRAIAVDVTTAPNLRIAYLPGTGDEVPAYLPSLGVTPTILNAKDLTLATLKQYDAILLGVRAYSAHPELAGPGSKPLLDYAAAGGIVITQYNSGGFDSSSAPFPYTLPGDPAHNVVEEEQPVTLLVPAAPLLTWPNRISSADFDGWVEERGHGFASEWAREYQPLLEAHDAGQDPQRGGLLLAPVGKGAYIYCAFALYRQLPEGVPGAYRLMANLLSYAKNPHR